MTFCFKHLSFGTEKTYSADAPPAWMNHRENAWFRDAHVLTLGVGDHVLTDWHKITRVA